MTAPDAIAALEAAGFTGFLTIGQLHGDSCRSVPDARGVYVVLTRSSAPHRFLARSSAPVWRGREPSVPLEELAEHWVSGATVLFAGRARGPGVRNRLRQRIKRYLRFGHGKVVGSWPGRYVWQLGEVSRLVIAWRVSEDDEDPAEFEARFVAAFTAHHGAPPFANLVEDAVLDDADDGEGGAAD